MPRKTTAAGFSMSSLSDASPRQETKTEHRRDPDGDHEDAEDDP
jgi:hypothetical protein